MRQRPQLLAQAAIRYLGILEAPGEVSVGDDPFGAALAELQRHSLVDLDR